MRAEVKTDNTVRTIHIEIEAGSVPDLDVTEQWHAKPRVIRPDLAILIMVNGEPSTIRVYGGLILKDDVASIKVTDEFEWRAKSYRDPNLIEKAPEWVRLLWAEAPANVISWRDPAPEEVQAL